MLELRRLNDSDIPLIEVWLNKAHVKRWYEIPRLGITIDDWMSEIRDYQGEFRWITYCVVLWKSRPIGLCLYYRCADSEDEDFGNLPLDGSYGIDYFIGEESMLGRGLGKQMVDMLVKAVFRLPDAQRVTADVDKDNLTSQKTLLACGFNLLTEQKSRYCIERDNTTPMNAIEYDQGINNVVPYYGEFYRQTIDVITQCGYKKLKWLDLGCGTGTMEEIALVEFDEIDFVIADPSDKMLEQAKLKLRNDDISYECVESAAIEYVDRFNVVTAIQSHHYMSEERRIEAVKRVYQALQTGGIYICFENVVPDDDDVRQSELLRWGRYQQRHGRTAEEAKAHNARCGVKYFPLTVEQHIRLLKNTGFRKVHVFWYSYMQMGIYGVK